jgi:hypothetical protein
MDQLLDGKLEVTGELYDHQVMCSWDWIDDFMPTLNWWIVLSDIAFEGGNPPATAHHRKALSGLLVDVFMAYEPAHQEANSYAEKWPDGTATLELVKKYRTYTRYVTAFALEVWPDLILERAFN